MNCANSRNYALDTVRLHAGTHKPRPTHDLGCRVVPGRTPKATSICDCIAGAKTQRRALNTQAGRRCVMERNIHQTRPTLKEECNNDIPQHTWHRSQIKDKLRTHTLMLGPTTLTHKKFTPCNLKSIHMNGAAARQTSSKASKHTLASRAPTQYLPQDP